MLRLFEAHREAEAARDMDAILKTSSPTVSSKRCHSGCEATAGTPSEQATSNSSSPRSQIWHRRTRASPSVMTRSRCGECCVEPARGEWLGIPPGGRTLAVPFANVVPFSQGLIAGERIYFDLATLCEQAWLPIEQVRAAAAARR